MELDKERPNLGVVIVRASLETSVAIGDLKLGGDTNLEHELSSPESFLGVELEC